MKTTLTLVLLLAACEPSGKVDTATCSSGQQWTGGDEESPLMNPGQDCIACHASGEGPNYTVAGTVMGDYGDPDDCDGVEGVTVRLTGADDAVIELITNEAGNFFTTDAIAMPYTAEVELDGRTLSMTGEQETGACASCHTEEGLEGAPGRVVAP